MRQGSDIFRVVFGIHALAWAMLTLPINAQEALQPGQPLQKDLAKETHTYRLDLPIEGRYRLIVQQFGRDVALVLREPDGEQIMASNSPNGKWGTELLFPPAGKPLLLEIVPRGKFSQGQASAYRVLLEQIVDPIPEVEIILARARARYFEKDWQGAFDQWTLALPKIDRLDHQTHAETLFGMGYCSSLLSRPDQALDYYRQALPLWRELGLEFQRARTLSSMGFAHQSVGNHREALPRYEAALALFHQEGDLSWQATVCANLGNVYDVLGEPQKAGDYYAQSLEHFRQAGDVAREAWLLNNMGALYRRMGAWQTARDHYQRALSVLRVSGDRRWQARTLNSLGYLYLELGQAERAASFFDDALPLRRQVGDKRGEAITLSNLGTARRLTGHLQEALADYERALQLQRTIGDREGEAKTLDRLGSAELEMGQTVKALAHYRQALTRFEAVGNRRLRANTFTHIGAAYLAQGETQSAADHLDRALEQHRSLRNPAGETETLLLKARLARRHNRLEEARDYLEASVRLVESQRTRIVSTELRISWFATVSACYEQLIDVLMALHRRQPLAGHEDEALLVSERNRARGLLELLRESETNLSRGIDADLLSQRRDVQQRLSARSAFQLKLLSGPHDEAAARAAEKSLQEILIELGTLDTRIRLANPHHATLTAPPMLTADEIRQMVDHETLLLVYALGESASVLWSVTPDRIEAHELPPRKRIEAAAGEYYRHLSVLDPGGRADQSQAAANLSRILLSPVSGQLQDRRLVIVADGPLHFIPFAALPMPGRQGPVGTPLLVGHEIVMLPSLSYLSLAWRGTVPENHQRRVAILADPVFSPDDPRLEPIGTPSALAKTRSIDASQPLTRLTASRHEAQTIANLAANDLCLLALDFEATRETVLSGALRTCNIIHFATHGLINDRHPELTGVVFSRYDKTGRPRPGLLTLPDIFNLELDAGLVVLSGCRTVWGKQVRGEGLVGLARGFLHAGAQRIVASHWPVEDRATAILMEHFYTGLLVQGKKPAAALRAAKLALRKQRRYRDPWYWAAFTIHGDWR